jgi:hypothetical protein
MDIHQCPRCELRFASKAEAEAHALTDHGVPLERTSTPVNASKAENNRERSTSADTSPPPGPT